MANQEQYVAQINEWVVDAVGVAVMLKLAPEGSTERQVLLAGMDHAFEAVPTHAIAMSVIGALVDQLADRVIAEDR